MNDLSLISIDDLQFMCDSTEVSEQDMFSVNEQEFCIDDLEIDDLWAK